eukprot:4635253-Pyramimonas_sp.AAC.1
MMLWRATFLGACAASSLSSSTVQWDAPCCSASWQTKSLSFATSKFCKNWDIFGSTAPSRFPFL